MVETLRPSGWCSKKVVLKIADTNVPGKNNMVTAAMVIMEVESRCVCLASLAVLAAICVLVRDSAWLTRWKSWVD